jgi:hypothetical protein
MDLNYFDLLMPPNQNNLSHKMMVSMSIPG